MNLQPRAFLAAVAALALACTAAPAPRIAGPDEAPIFRFSTDAFWLNLHHYLYVLGRAERGERDASRRAVARAPADAEAGLSVLSEEERGAWREAVSIYAAGPSGLDTVFSPEMFEATRALGAARGDSLEGVAVPGAMRRALELAAPAYRKAWWPAHRAANEAWAETMGGALADHGARILDLITGWYEAPWPPDGYPVYLSGYTNWAGAYSTEGNLLVLSSLDPGLRESRGLEILFHEAMHQWDGPIGDALEAAARATGVEPPPGLSHAMIFFTAGEAVRRVVPGHVPYAEAERMWERRLGRFKPALDAAWKPWLDGEGTREEAFRELTRAAGSPRDPDAPRAAPESSSQRRR